MHLINAINVNDAFHQAHGIITEFGVKSDSRNGPVIAPTCPVLTTYHKPTERVLFSPNRDANPFFHFFEALWMIEGNNDARWLDYFVSDFSSRYAEADGRQWGAYGYRWRHHFGIDQLDVIVNRLRLDHNDRRVVIQMWDAGSDLFDPNELDVETNEPFPEPRDVPCNTQIYPRIVNGALDISILCRSNDVVWGAYGANAVHFSMLQEYLAGRIGVAVGKMYQFSNNWHLYESVAKKLEPVWIREYPGTVPMGTVWDRWDEDLRAFMSSDDIIETEEGKTLFHNSWFDNVVIPMWNTFVLWKEGLRNDAKISASSISAPDWRCAVLEWMDRRMKK